MLSKQGRGALANASMHTQHLMITTMDVAFAKCITLFFLVILLTGGAVSFCSTIKKSDGVLCIESEKLALLSFKQELVDEGDHLSSWIAEADDCCRWTGIVCDNITGHVKELYLTRSGGIHDLYGRVSPSLVNLTRLTHLELNSFDANGSQIPKFLGSLVHLRYLSLAGANFGGMIPQQLGNLTNLYHLRLGDYYPSPNELYANNLEWLCGLSSLKFLDLSFVNLSKASDRWLLAINKVPSLLELHLSFSELNRIHRLPAHVNFTSLEVLDISGNNFNSVLPDWIFSLSNLILLDLHNSNFIGPFPNGYWVLNSLTHLDAAENFLNSTIPSYLYGFASLQSLDLTQNSLQGVISSAIGNLTSITHLGLSYNSLKGELPMSIRNLRNLKELFIVHNQLNGSFPESLVSLSNLTTLDISYNQFKGVVTEVHFANLTRLIDFSASGNSLNLRVSPEWIPPFNLAVLDLESWNLGPQFPMWLKSQKNIQTVVLSNTGISGIVPSWFWGLSYPFHFIDLCNNQLYGELPAVLPTSVLSIVYLCSNKFNGSIPLNSFDMNGLDLSNNSLSGDISEALCHPKSLYGNSTILSILDLGDNLLSGNISDCWAKWPELLVIDLGNNNLTGKIPSSMGSLQKLRFLYLHNNSLAGEIPSSLANCTALKNLDLSLNKFVGRVPTSFGVGLSNLKILDLRSNKLSGRIPIELCRLTGLQILDAAINNLSGTIPICFNNFSAMATKNHSLHSSNFLWETHPLEKAYLVMKGREDIYSEIVSLVTSLDLSSNNLSGEIPKQLTSLQGLISLNLSRNHLRGNIPNNIGNMGSIISLDISRNQLSGKIPPGMASLNFLSSLNVSFNNLSGEIPLSTQLQSFNASSFIGNQLCGPPLPNKCRADHNASVVYTEDEEGEKDEVEYWFRLGVAVGFVVGFLGVISPLVFYRFYRRVYYWFFQEYLWYKILDRYNKFKRMFNLLE